eukprot:GHVT01044763.1.p1 GENE.GHVT01044763.1~~GHVT01044763.1.p1  ORF type:complete len:139 (+),score=11.53 GHVT01044763.1:39-455(+)
MNSSLKQIVYCCLATLILVVLVPTEGAPTRQKRSPASLDTSITLEMADLDAVAQETAGSPSVRHKRHAEEAAIVDEAGLDVPSMDSLSLSPRLSRRRRSAAWWLAASIRLCNSYQDKFCKGVTVREGDIHLHVRLADE